ncbi:SMI1/KNR4 family protein [Neptuniibacter halophilus]|uniref:SMI1/KNR4 family protein n=1 Tax=Neptuniibacter halophilus TaxID=651666 RepID=UPI0025725ACA|nr:SMI1/KNR4 family protein [Neptuniibacter halophilus]
MEDIIELLQERNADVPVPLELPDDDDLVEIEEQILISLPDEYKEFLLEVSDVICGSLEPATVADPQSHTFLPEMAATAWDIGMPREFIPVCEHAQGYYCISQEAQIFLWQRDEGLVDEWPSIWNWAKEVWLES